MGRYKTKLQAIQEANKNLLKEQYDEFEEARTRAWALQDKRDQDKKDFDKDGDVDELDEIQKELHRAITTWFGGRMTEWISHHKDEYGGVSQGIMKDEELISKKIEQIIGDVFAGINLLGGGRNSPYRGDRY